MWRMREEKQEGGIIPAYAGSTAGPPHQTAPFPDHPRIRGEHSAPARARARIAGSSPHTRGARQAPAQTRTPRWIIPAYAGSTTSSPPPAVGHGDHPRIRGEHLRGGAAVISAVGSSPHTRGAPSLSLFLSTGWRIIPAYAGSTPLPDRTNRSLADHPRIRGEHPAGRPLHVSIAGSSPHTRGAPGRHGRDHHLPGIIPAYAGSTWRTPCPGWRGGDHPRIRGEHEFRPPALL